MLSMEKLRDALQSTSNLELKLIKYFDEIQPRIVELKDVVNSEIVVLTNSYLSTNIFDVRSILCF